DGRSDADHGHARTGAAGHHGGNSAARIPPRALRPVRGRPRPTAGPRPGRRRGGPMTFQLILVLAACLFSTGLFGALSQQSIVMVLMGIELMIGGIIVAAVDLWRYQAPESGGGQVVIVAAVVAMAVEMAMGFGITTAIFRARQVDMTDMARDLK